MDVSIHTCECAFNAAVNVPFMPLWNAQELLALQFALYCELK
jgi:hypothetical protein